MAKKRSRDLCLSGAVVLMLTGSYATGLGIGGSALAEETARNLGSEPAASAKKAGAGRDPAATAAQAWGFEIKANYRDSEEAKFPSPFLFDPSQLPPGQTRGFLETPDAGGHAEVSVVTLFYKGQWRNGLAAKVKLDLIDKYDRNPTSTDRKWDVDEAWLRWGPETAPGDPHEGLSAYAKLGKFPKFERQNDRHLESYGLMGHSFNRMEDVGLEIGYDLGSVFYVKTSLTQGNPLFFRDVNALAGDNGTEDRFAARPTAVQSGLPILYDADVDHLDFSHPEVGLGLGLRFNDPEGRFDINFLAWGYARELAENSELHGTRYGADLDLLRGPEDRFPPPALSGNEKQEFGANLWVYVGSFSFFGQYVDSEAANLKRKGFEVEVHYEFEMPYLELFGQQVLSYVAPAVRYSEVEPEFLVHPQFPAPSIIWPWEKLDLGLRMGLIAGLDLTLEYNDNEFIRRGLQESEDEYLATFRYNWKRER